ARGVQGHAAGMAPDDVERAAVRDGQDALAGVAGRQVVDGGDDARLELPQRLAAFQRTQRIAAAPGLRGLRRLLLQIFHFQPFQHAEAAFADAWLGAYAQIQRGRQRGGRIVRALEIAAVERRERVFAGRIAQPLGQQAGLFAAGFVQRDVLPALQAALAVPVGFAVSDEPDLSHALVFMWPRRRRASRFFESWRLTRPAWVRQPA